MSEDKAYMWARRMEEGSWKGRHGQVSSHLECQRGACSLFCRQWGATEGSGGRAETVQSKKTGGQDGGQETTEEAGAELRTWKETHSGSEGQELAGHFFGEHISTSWAMGPHL